MKLYSALAYMILFQTTLFGQDLPLTKEGIREKGIKSIIFKTYTLKGELSQVHEAQYDNSGKLNSEKTKTIKKDVDHVWDFVKGGINSYTTYRYDNNDNVVEENIVDDFFPFTKKWEYEYDELNRIAIKTTFNLHNKANRTNHYFYNGYGEIVKDSVVIEGKPSLLKEYVYNGKRLIKTTSTRVYNAQYKIESTGKFLYNKNGKLVKVLYYRSYSDQEDLTDNFFEAYKYNKEGLLKSEVLSDKVFKYLYNKENMICKRILFESTKGKRPKYKKSNYDIIEYEYYD